MGLEFEYVCVPLKLPAKKMKTIRILILEDDLETLSHIFVVLSKLEESLSKSKNLDIAATALSEYTQVIDYVNKLPKGYFDICLLDRDCKACGSFHVLNLEKIGPDKIIGISSIPKYNNELIEKGVENTIHKNYEKLEEFSRNLLNQLRNIINSVSLL